MKSTAIASISRWLAAVSLALLNAGLLGGNIVRSVVSAQAGACAIATASGGVVGSRNGDVCLYMGIPYAAPPTGALRWRPPQPRAPWAPVVLPATAATAPACAQIGAGAGGAVSGIEDCLTLNIWAPTAAPAARGYPVMVWLHGGDFRATSASFAASNGRLFAQERRTLVVAPNYRLGPFGFLAHSALTREDPGYTSSGNYGLADQRAALRWVRDNIAAFGGDPENVTLFGQSAGAVATSLHLVSPAARGLFHRAVLHSGQASHRWRTASEAEAQGEALATALGCTNPATVVACLRQAGFEQVLRALPTAQQQFSETPGAVTWGPIVDGLEVPDQPRDLYRRGLFARIPVMVGAVGDEGWIYADRSFPGGLDALQYERAVRGEFGMDADAVLKMYAPATFATPKDALSRLMGDFEVVCEARRVARALHHDGAPVYLYSFEYTVDAVSPGRSIHGMDVNFVFGNSFAAPSNHVLTARDLSLFDTISTFWARFAETGDPNPRGVPVQWPPYRPGPYDPPVAPARSDHHFVFGERLGVSSYVRDPLCNFWESFFFRSAGGNVPAAAR